MESTEIIDLDKTPNSPSERYGHSTCIVDQILYLYGGCSLDGKQFFNDLHLFDLQKMEWIEKAKVSENIDGRHFHTCVPEEEGSKKLIFFGGKSNGYKNDVFIFDIQKMEFKIIEPRFKDEKKKNSCVNDDVQPPSPRYGHSACYFKKMMYVFGGYDRNGFTKNDLYSFNFKTNMWKRYVISKIPFRYHHSSALLNGNLFIVGGITKKYSTMDDIYRFELPGKDKGIIEEEEEDGEEEEEEEKIKKIDDHAVESFKVTVENPIGSYGHKCFVLDGKIYMYGGRNKNKEFKHLLYLHQERKYGNLRWIEAKNFKNFDEEKLDVSYGSLDIFNNKLLFFGGQFRGEKKIKHSNTQKKEEKKKIEEEEENDDEEEEDLYFGENLPYDVIWEILDFLDTKDLILLGSVSKEWIFSECGRADRIWGLLYKKESMKIVLPSFRIKKVRRQKTTFLKYRMLKYQEFQMQKDRPKGYYNSLNLKIPNIKIVINGDGAVGKTCLFVTYASGRFPDDYIPTVFDNYSAGVMYGKKMTNLNLWDTGEEDYDMLRPLSYPGTHMFILCYSVVSRWSMENISAKWKPEVQKHCPKIPIVLVGTKIDLREDPKIIKELKEKNETVIEPEEGKRLAKKIGAVKYFETSSLRNFGIKELFDGIIDIVLNPKYFPNNFDENGNPKKGICGVM